MLKRFLIKQAGNLVPPMVLWIAVLMLAVINPLACLIHCTIMHGVHQPQAEQEHYLCSLFQKEAETAQHAHHLQHQTNQTHEQHSSAFVAPQQKVALIHNYIPSDAPSDPLKTIAPRAVYESLPSVGAWLSFTMALVAMVVKLLVRFTSRFNPPLLPPPRWA